jgi:hypothetical protein
MFIPIGTAWMNWALLGSVGLGLVHNNNDLNCDWLFYRSVEDTTLHDRVKTIENKKNTTVSEPFQNLIQTS